MTIDWYLIFLLCFLFHEAGHYLWALKYNCYPKIVIKWYGAMVTGFYEKLTYKQFINVLLAGVFIGLIPSYLILQSESTVLFFTAYIVMSSADILQIIILSWKLTVHGNRKLVDVPFLISG